MPQKFPKVMSTFGVTPYSPDRDDPEKNRQLYEHYQDQVSTQPLAEDTLPWNVPFPPGQFAQAEFDDMLQRRIVDPLAQAGMEDLGAGLAAVPSAAHSMVVPQTEFDVAGTIIPLPGVAKLMKKGKFRKIRNAMKAEDPENVGEIIAKQAGKVSDSGEKIYATPEEIRNMDLESRLAYLKENDPIKYHTIMETKLTEKARKLLDPESYPIENGKKAYGPRHPTHEGYRVLPGKEKEFQKLIAEAEKHGKAWEKIKDEKYKSEKEARIRLSPDNAEQDMFKVDQKRRLKEDTERIERQLKEPPKPPKGDPEASRPQFPGIRSQLDIAPSRMNERGEAFGDVGQSEFRPYDQPMPASLEPIQKRNYVESELDPVQQTITKVLADPAMAELTPQQKQALADFVRYRYKTNADMTTESAFDTARNIKDAPQSIKGVSGSSRDLYDRDIYRKENKIDPYWSDEGWEAYQKLDKAFGPDQAIIRYRHPAVKKMFDTLWEDAPFGRSDTSFDESRDLQNKMYKGRPSHEAEQEKFGKIKEAMGEAKRFSVEHDLNGMERLGTFDNASDAYDALVKAAAKMGFSEEDVDDLLVSGGIRIKEVKAAKAKPIKGSYKKAVYRIVDPSGNDVKELGYFGDYESGRESLEKWLRSKGMSGDELEDALYDYQVMHENGIPF